MRRNAGTELLASWQYDILDAFLPPAWVTFIFPADEITSALYLELLQDLTWNIKQISNKESQLSHVFESSYRKIKEKIIVFLYFCWNKKIKVHILLNNSQTMNMNWIWKKIQSENHSHELFAWLTYLGESSHLIFTPTTLPRTPCLLESYWTVEDKNEINENLTILLRKTPEALSRKQDHMKRYSHRTAGVK